MATFFFDDPFRMTQTNRNAIGDLMRALRLTLLCCCLLIPSLARSAEPNPRVRELILLLRNKEKDIAASQNALDELRRMGRHAEEAIPELKQALGEWHLFRPAVRALAAIGPAGWSALGQWEGNREEIEFILSTLREQRGTAIRAVETVSEHRDFFFGIVPIDRDALKEIRVYSELYTGREPSICALPALMRALKDPEPKVRIAAAQALAKMGPKARPATATLVEMLDDPWPLEEDKETFGYYLMKPYGVRSAAVSALLAIGSAAEESLVRDGVPKLVAGLRNGNEIVRRHTADALQRLGPRAKPAAPLLVLYVPKAYSPVIDNDGLLNPYYNALRAIGPDAIPTLTAWLTNTNARYRDNALDLLGELGEQAHGALEVILRAPDDDDEWIRRMAIRTAARVAPTDKRVITALIARLEDCKPDVRKEAARVLGLIGPPAKEALPVLRKLRRQEPDLAADCSRAIQIIDDRQGRIKWCVNKWAYPVRAIVLTEFSRGLAPKKVSADDLDVQFGIECAIKALGAAYAGSIDRTCKRLLAIGPPAAIAVPRLKASLHHEEYRVRMFVAATLIHLTGEKEPYATLLIRGLREDPSAAEALGELGAEWPWAIAALVNAIDNPGQGIGYLPRPKWEMRPDLSPRELIRFDSVRALTMIGPAALSAVPDLIRLLRRETRNRNRENSIIEWEIVAAIGSVGYRARAAAPLLRQIQLNRDSSLRDHIELNLRRLEDPWVPQPVRGRLL